jgi:hypothetical protein
MELLFVVTVIEFPPVKFLNILLLNEDEIWGSYGSEFVSYALT